MGTFLLRRLFHTALVVWGALSLLFFLIWLMPGDVADRGGEVAAVQTDAIERNLDRLYGLDDPVWLQYVKSLERIATFDFGTSSTNRDIGEMLGEAVITSGRLAFWGVLLYSVLGVGAGVIAAARHNGLFDRFSGFVSIFLVAFPPFVMGILLQIVLGVIPFQRDWPRWLHFPTQWQQDRMTWFFVFPTGGTWKFLILPTITLACVNLGGILRTSRTVMLEVLRADYLRTAKAKGVTRRRVLFKHGLRNAMIPIVTNIGSDIPNTLGFAILTETVWNIPGLGFTISQSVFAQDTRTVLAFCGVVVLIAAITSLLVDLSYGWLDPRVRLGDR
jgi:ABC-type dipeptide/oligopeptide/nickel transport system permease component